MSDEAGKTPYQPHNGRHSCRPEIETGKVGQAERRDGWLFHRVANLIYRDQYLTYVIG